MSPAFAGHKLESVMDVCETNMRQMVPATFHTTQGLLLDGKVYQDNATRRRPARTAVTSQVYGQTGSLCFINFGFVNQIDGDDKAENKAKKGDLKEAESVKNVGGKGNHHYIACPLHRVFGTNTLQVHHVTFTPPLYTQIYSDDSGPDSQLRFTLTSDSHFEVRADCKVSGTDSHLRLPYEAYGALSKRLPATVAGVARLWPQQAMMTLATCDSRMSRKHCSFHQCCDTSRHRLVSQTKLKLRMRKDCDSSRRLPTCEVAALRLIKSFGHRERWSKKNRDPKTPSALRPTAFLESFPWEYKCVLDSKNYVYPIISCPGLSPWLQIRHTRLDNQPGNRQWHEQGQAIGKPSCKTTLSTPGWDSNPDIPVIGSLVYCKSDALDHVATKTGRDDGALGSLLLKATYGVAGGGRKKLQDRLVYETKRSHANLIQN
uniref:Uncharacterized protein n=1 Tax=Timema cristinae TaxID=61476 RepID=A0A7R9GP03_TIMCR|nr:unnamed protein product [Timema cristinae]